MLPERDATLLRDMRDQARLAIDVTVGRTRDEMATDPLLPLALERLIAVIGEAASQVTEGTRAWLVTLPWRQMIAMRNRLIHAYWTVDHGVVWDTVRDDLPGLVAELERILTDHAEPPNGDA